MKTLSGRLARWLGAAGSSMTPLGGRVARWLGADGNPMRRRIDRVESAVRVVLLLVFLASGPLLASMAGRWVEQAGRHEMRQQQSWRQVNAVLLQPAPRPFDTYGSMAAYWVAARWQAPSGKQQVGEVLSQAGAPAGTSISIWVDRAGRLTGHQPMTMRVVVIRMVLAGILAIGGLATALLFVSGLIRWQLNRRRMAYWAMEWAAFGPRWTKLR